MKTQMWSNLTKTTMSRARAERYACSMMTIWMRKSELIILSFLFKRKLSNKICFEIWARQQRLIRLFTVVDTPRWRFSRNRACIFRESTKSPKLIFITLKRRLFPLLKTIISSLSELYRIGKTCLEKMLQN